MDGDLEELAAAAARWLLAAARPRGAGLTWPTWPSDPDEDPSLYSGTAGAVVALLEAHAHFGGQRWADAAQRGSVALAEDASREAKSSWYFGTTGIAFALHAVGTSLGDPAALTAARRALDVVRGRFDGERWGAQFELLGGNAGIALGALALGDAELALLAVEPYTRTSEPTAGGVTWEGRTGMVARFHHLSHGTLGIVAALAAVGEATGRGDLVDLALAGAADVVSRNEAGATGFLVPHSDPQHRPELIARYSYGWCHGPAGDAQAFRLLGRVTGSDAWDHLAGRCWHTVTDSGLPERLRPGFWDNSGRCCGTAGVLALAVDRIVERGDDLTFARRLVDDLRTRATLDATGARWSNVEHRADPPELEPRTGWAMGNAGVLRELLRFARVTAGGDSACAVPFPDQPVASSPRT